MTPKSAEAHTVSDIYGLLRYAAAHGQPVAGSYEARKDETRKNIR
jgi:hypothetical protein